MNREFAPIHVPENTYPGPFPDIWLIILMHVLAFCASFFAFVLARKISRLQSWHFGVHTVGILLILRACFLTALHNASFERCILLVYHSRWLLFITTALVTLVAVLQVGSFLLNRGNTREEVREQPKRELLVLALIIATAIMPLYSMGEETLLYEWAFWPKLGREF